MSVFEEMTVHRVVPVISILDAKDALPLADALIEAGLPVAEITFRTSAAVDAIAAIARHRPDMVVGAGTVLNEKQLDTAQAAGAKFALSPGIDTEVLSYAQRVGMPFAPGIMTPSDVQMALRAGCNLVKFFPAASAGGLPMLKSLAEPFRHLRLKFNPTGGITVGTMSEWLSYGPVVAVGGSWIATSEDISQGNWEDIFDRARTASAMVEELLTNGDICTQTEF